jgi:hypothetical protein
VLGAEEKQTSPQRHEGHKENVGADPIPPTIEAIMPVDDKYHDNVVRALEKEGWRITADPMTLYVHGQHLYVDLRAEKDNQVILVEIKVFEGNASPATYLAQSLGQYLLYQVMVGLLRWNIPIYLAIPEAAYKGFLSKRVASTALNRLNAKLIVYNPINEVIAQWIT